MTLRDLIAYLEREDSHRVVPMGFHHPHSYRGCFTDLAFEPVENITVGEMLNAARSALNKTYPGWKGGEYTMSPNVDVWLAEEGECGESIGPILLNYMLGKYHTSRS